MVGVEKIDSQFLSPCPLGCCPSSWRFSRSSEGFTPTQTRTHAHETSTQIFPLVVSPVNSSHTLVVCRADSRKQQFIPGDLLPLHSHNTEVVETCYNPSSCSLLHNHVVDHFPAQMGEFGRIVNVSGISCRPEGLLRPSKHQEYPALEKVSTPCEKPNTAGTSGHESFSLLVKKKEQISARLTASVLW